MQPAKTARASQGLTTGVCCTHAAWRSAANHRDILPTLPPTLPCPALPCRTLLHPNLPYPTLPTLLHPTLPYPTLCTVHLNQWKGIVTDDMTSWQLHEPLFPHAMQAAQAPNLSDFPELPTDSPSEPAPPVWPRVVKTAMKQQPASGWDTGAAGNQHSGWGSPSQASGEWGEGPKWVATYDTLDPPATSRQPQNQVSFDCAHCQD